MPFCVNCGTKLPDTAKFCPNCGTPVGGVPASPAQGADPKPTSTGPNKEELIGYLVAYADQLRIMENAVKRLFIPTSDGINRDSFPITFKNGIEDVEYFDKYKGAPTVMNLFGWGARFKGSTVLSQTVLLRYHIKFESYKDEYQYRVDYIGSLPEPLKKLLDLYFSNFDSDTIVAIRTKLIDFFKLSHNGKIEMRGYRSWHISQYAFDAWYPSLEKLYKVSLMDLPSFSNLFKTKGYEFYIHLYRVYELIENCELFQTWVPSSYQEGLFVKRTVNYNKGVELKKSELLSSFGAIMFYYPNDTEMGNICNIACDVINELVKNIEDSCNKIWNLPTQYRNSQSALALARILMDGKADTWKEAVNLFDTESYRKEVLQKLGNIEAQISSLTTQVNEIGGTMKVAATAILEHLDMTNLQLNVQNKKLASIATSTLITAVFGN